MSLPADGSSDAERVKTCDTHNARFRFKRKHDEETEQRRERSRRHKSRRSDQRRGRRHKSDPQPVDDPSAYDDSVSGLPPDTAFRESLFDAMGDDEGAAFWEGVYGHPIHNYPNTYQNQETGEIEQMDDEEYAQYVRRKMWERSWEGIEAAREEKRREREQEKRKIREEERTEENHRPQKQDADYVFNEADYIFDMNIEKSLRRGERRRDRKRWKTLWEAYLEKWTDLQTLRDARIPEVDEDQIFLRNRIAWPVESGKRKDVNADEVERFLKNCTESIDSEHANINTTLKFERVRWHPDKIQQRYGFMNIDERTMQGVTSVFQILDQMWSDHRTSS